MIRSVARLPVSGAASPSGRTDAFVAPGAVRLWHKLDATWRVPKTYVAANVVSPMCYAHSPDAVAHLRLVCSVVRQRLNANVAYEARCAGLGFSIAPGADSLSLRASGWSDKVGAPARDSDALRLVSSSSLRA